MSDDLLTIGSFAMLSGLSIPALRHYDDVGVLKPAEVDGQTGYRRYEPGQIPRARLIRALRAIDLPIDELRDVLDAEDEHYVRDVLVAHRGRLKERSYVLTQQLEALDEYIERGVQMPTLVGSRIAELIVITTDAKRDQKFYSETFGVHFMEEQHGDGPLHYHASWGGSSEDFFLFTLTTLKSDHRTYFGFLVDDLHATYKRALAAGATDIAGPQHIEGMPEIAQVADPSGNVINLYQSE
jgi:DNA-binding transcriptional MerR regulator